MDTRARKRRGAHRYVAATVAIAASCALVAPIAANEKTIATIETTLAAAVYYVGGNLDSGSVNYQKIWDAPGGVVANGTTPNSVPYPASIWPVTNNFWGFQTFGTSVNQGEKNLATMTAGQDDITVAGYSLGAVVVNKYHQALVNGEVPNAPTNVQFLTIASANKPNGGILARFPQLNIPILNIQSNGAVVPDDKYNSTDVTREYDTYGDFPAYFNPLSLVNAALAIQYVHPDANYNNINPDYFNGTTNVKSSVTNGNVTTTTYNDGSTKTEITTGTKTTTYYLVHTQHLPLLMPLRQLAVALGLPQGGIDAIEPVMRVLVDMGYDRTTSPGVPTGFSLFTPPQKFIDAANAMPGAVQQGVQNFQNPPPPPSNLGNATETETTPSGSNLKTLQKNSTPEQKPAPEDKPAVVTPPVSPAPPAPSTPPSKPETPAAIAVADVQPQPAGTSPPVDPGTPDIKTQVKQSLGTKVDTKPETKVDTKPETKLDTKPETKLETKPETKPETKQIFKPTIKLPKLPTLQGPSDATGGNKPPSLRDSFKSIPGLSKSDPKDAKPETAPKTGESEHSSEASHPKEKSAA